MECLEELENLAIKQVSMRAVKKYCENKETIQDVINTFNEFTKLSCNGDNSFEMQISKATFRIKTLSLMFCLKKFKDNREDLKKLIGVLDEEVKKLIDTAEEVE